MKTRPAARFERLCDAILGAYKRACAAPTSRAHARIRRAALVVCAESYVSTWDGLNHHNIARAFVRIAVAADRIADTATMFGAVQLAKAWGFDWRQWLRDARAELH